MGTTAAVSAVSGTVGAVAQEATTAGLKEHLLMRLTITS